MLLFKQITTCTIVFSLVICSTGCINKDLYDDNNNKYSEVFDFNMNKQINLDIDYSLNSDYYVFFELYAQNPIIEKDNSFVKNDSIEPLFKASTKKGGKYSNEIILPSYLNEVWLYSDFLGTVSPLKLQISDNKISFNQKEYIASLQKNTRAVNSSGFTYPDSWKILPGVTWDKEGLPSNLEKELTLPSAEILNAIKKTYNKFTGYRIPDIHPEWMEDCTSEIKIQKETEISLVFISSDAGWNNSVGYFTYPSNEVPTLNTIQKILAFPNASPSTKESGALVCGHEMKLKYWNKDKQSFEDKFPAGVTIGLFTEGMSFSDGNIKEQKSFCKYSYKSLNSDDKQHSVALRDPSTNKLIAIGLEDNKDFDYGDALFYIKTSESNAVPDDGPTIPPVEPPKEYAYNYHGTLAYEDQWPNVGDYDMNDVIVEYKSTIYKTSIDNTLIRMVDEFTPVHNGGTYNCGFGYQIPSISWNNISSITVNGESGWNIERDQTYPTITLFNDVKGVLNKKYKVTLEMTGMNSNNSNINPPYNPFIFSNTRGREVHLVNYPPTDKVDYSLFNTCDDKSNISNGITYITEFKDKDVNIMPYGINIPYVKDWNIPNESVKIFVTYPSFIDWVKSKGKTNTDWYMK